jgi:hypothetical protein
LAVVEFLVMKLDTFALRWACIECGKTFTELPEFLLPRKRYVKSAILQLGEEYLRDERSTYRNLVNWMGYGGKDGEIDERRPSHSRVWYWLETLGQIQSGLRRAKRLIRAKDPSSAGVGRAVHVPPKKYQSEPRCRQLETAWSVLQAEAEFVRLFGISLFPEFGTSLA